MLATCTILTSLVQSGHGSNHHSTLDNFPLAKLTFKRLATQSAGISAEVFRTQMERSGMVDPALHCDAVEQDLNLPDTPNTS